MTGSAKRRPRTINWFTARMKQSGDRLSLRRNCETYNRLSTAKPVRQRAGKTGEGSDNHSSGTQAVNPCSIAPTAVGRATDASYGRVG